MRALRVVFLVLLFAACRRSSTNVEPAPAPPVVTDAATGLMLTWIDGKGEFHVEDKVADVPASARDLVRVADPTREPSDHVYLADLRAPGPEGRYAVRAGTLEDFERAAVERRKQTGTVLAATPPSDAAAPLVIVYGASWCGPCHQAKAYLEQSRVPFVEKDIENDPGAAREMQAKLAKVGRPAGSIPVLDVGGQILVGFDARALDRALGRTR